MVSPAPPLASWSDYALVQAVAAGDGDALGELYDRFSPLLLALGRRILADAEEAEDVVQETFVHLWRRATSYDPQKSSVSTFLVLVTRSRAIDRLRTRQVIDRTLGQVGLEPSATLDTSGDGVSRVLNLERRERVRQELATLPDEQRQVLDLAFFDGLTQREIAERTGIPLGTVKTRTLLAMRKLRTVLRLEIRELL
ncbi:MAG: sigma-70 family RNA polymerase sigma factor [Thermoanaerobaculia bacterium]|nr:sigma-70 family RNA polymerase sigma factor [Thermoanaerobaculia bacterium]